MSTPTGAPQVIGLGFAAVDVIMRVDRMPTWDQTDGIVDFGIAGGGPIGSACVAAARLGVRAGYIGTAGDDELAEMKIRFLAEEGVDTSRIIRHAGPDGFVVMAYVDSRTGDRVFGSAGKHQRADIAPDDLDRDYIVSADFLHLDATYRDAAVAAARLMRDAGKRVMIDGGTTRGPISDTMRELIALSDVLICGSGFGTAVTDLTEVWAVGDAIRKMGPDIVVQTEGERGSFTTSPVGRQHIPVFPVDVVDTTGAGDVFHGAYLAGLLNGWDVETTGVFATAASAINCTYLGCRTGMPTMETITAFLTERNITLPDEGA